MTRRRWLIWGIAAYLAILVAVALALLLLYRAARDRLDEALGQRLLGVAGTVVALVEDGDAVVAWTFDPQADEDPEFLWLATRLEQIRVDNDLAEITLTDPYGRVLISATERLDRGSQNVFWELDPAASDLALTGFTAVSSLYRVRDVYQKSAHAPLLTTRGELAGIVTVEGNADFFDALATLRSGALVTLATVLLFLTIMGVILWQLDRSLQRYRASVLRQENLAAMGRMTAGIAHEIRNPLGIIRGAGQHLQRRLDEAGIEDEVAAFIPEEVDRLDTILAGYLAFGSDSSVEPEEIELDRLVRRSIALLQDELAAGGVTAELGMPPTTMHTRGDPRRLQQVLFNLLLNARDAMPEGGRVVVALRADGGEAILNVIDEGLGLGGAAAEKLFEPFWTTKTKGSGLGLSVSQRIATEHGGRLELQEREDGHGVVATLHLPLLSAGEGSRAATAAPQAPRGDEPAS